MVNIITNQIGYQCKEKKVAVFRNVTGTSFSVVNANTGKEVYNSIVSSPIDNVASNEVIVLGDFSSVTTPGTYQIKMEGAGVSYPFRIDVDVYKPVLRDLFRMYYLQRCGCEVTKELGGIYAHPACHTSLATIYGTDKKIDVIGGWHDAGDYGRYIVAAAVTIADLLYAYEANCSIFEKNFDIPESNQTTPDLLCEVRYELEWMLKMQDPETGGVYHKVTCAGFPGFVMPEEETEPLIVSPISVTATASFAACIALAIPFYYNYDEEFCKKCYQAATRAWDALQDLHMPGGFKNPADIVTGEYADATDTDEIYWAAAEMYKLTGKQMYHDAFKKLVTEKVWLGYGWEDVGSFGNRAYLTTSFPTDHEVMNKITESTKEYGKQLFEASKKDGYGVSLGNSYIWGSNMVVANNALVLLDCYHLTKDKSYRFAAKEHLDYLFGKNPMATCYVTGHGITSPMHPHHRPSVAKNKPMPGMLVGGPDAGLHDPQAVATLTGMPPAKCYVDHFDSYSTNEITIYWNAPLITLLAEFM
ncbi:glycoside hydrolase family 9 protein [Anaerosporobacter faecicola]|uniref:glycoside hydrolase family 9 protein n=1 Tax=Anaerosporobacter faecicola TaxID=2718714 RepID=UPI00143A8FCD|nr:glycoside hydrolase family 9 protein [Anaerosporobacter faecicola]